MVYARSGDATDTESPPFLRKNSLAFGLTGGGGPRPPWERILDSCVRMGWSVLLGSCEQYGLGRRSYCYLDSSWDAAIVVT